MNDKKKLLTICNISSGLDVMNRIIKMGPDDDGLVDVKQALTKTRITNKLISGGLKNANQ